MRLASPFRVRTTSNRITIKPIAKKNQLAVMSVLAGSINAADV